MYVRSVCAAVYDESELRQLICMMMQGAPALTALPGLGAPATQL